MKKVLLAVVGGYLVLALGNKAAEAAGAIRCGCADDCWCKQPGLILFRWVFPWGHRNEHHADEHVPDPSEAGLNRSR